MADTPDFVKIIVVDDKKGVRVVPEFVVCNSNDLMVKGGAFCAVWLDKKHKWSTNEYDIVTLVDEMVLDKCSALSGVAGDSTSIKPVLLKNMSSKKWNEWKTYLRNCPDNYKSLDENVISFGTELKRSDYATKTLPYEIKEGSFDAYKRIMSTIYEPEERTKLEWMLGSIFTGDSKRLQKFFVLYGDKGTGKSTFIDIACELLEGYWAPIVSKRLGQSGDTFSLEQLSSNPLLAIEHEGNLSKIDDNTKLNSIVSHETMMINEKFKRPYPMKFNTILLIGTNNPVKITDAKSGLLRRLIDVNPSGKLVPEDEYYDLIEQIHFELGAIAYHCIQVYKKLGFRYYSKYKPSNMMNETNEFYNFILDEDEFFEENKDFMTLNCAWQRYRQYCDDANIRYPLTKTPFKNELKNYFDKFFEKTNGYSNVFRGFKDFTAPIAPKKEIVSAPKSGWLVFNTTVSLLDDVLKDCPAQGCKEDGSPLHRWVNVKTTLKDIDTRLLHWVKPGLRLICIDFDILGPDGKKSLEENIKAASKWPPTYAELSKSGNAIHLYYWYDGDVSKISSLFAPYIEIKTFTGDASLRRKVSKCNDIDISVITSNLPLKGDNVTNWDGIKDEKHLFNMIGNALLKKTHPDTTSNIHFIKKILDDAYESGMVYSIPPDIIDDIKRFANSSTNQSSHCRSLVDQMHFQSKEISEVVKDEDASVVDDRIVFFDIEIYRPDKETNNPGLFLICWKFHGDKNIQVMINPKPHEVEYLVKNYKLAGFNCKAYDNKMLHGAMIGYSNEMLYELSQNIITYHAVIFPEAANYSYIDIYEMVTEKMGLKKWGYRLHMTHKEMGIPWDQPAPRSKWREIVEYCKNDVVLTEAVFDNRQEDFMARQMQVKLVYALHPDEGINVCVNDSTNTLSKRIVFGSNRHPQSEFNWRDLSKPVGSDRYEEYVHRFGKDYPFRVFDSEGRPLYRDYVPGEVLPDGYSILPFFKGYTMRLDKEKKKIVSTYLGKEVGEGGRVYSVPGYYEHVVALDISSMHPSSMEKEVQCGVRYQPVIDQLRKLRVAIKHKDFDLARTFFNGALNEFITEEYATGLAAALKIVINSIYGLTKAGFENEFRDPNNVDNITAKRGSLFMTMLQEEVESRGAFVCHIKTDCIKIPNASQEVIDFVVNFGREFGYEFEIEDVFTKFALFNDAAYIGYTDKGEWVTKADQFKKEKQSYLFKTLFSHEPYDKYDFCETKSVTDGALYLDMNENLGEPVDALYEKELRKLDRLRKKYGGDESPEVKQQIDICERLKADIPNHHKYVFVGRVGQFTPIRPGGGGGVLYRKNSDGSFSAATGSKGYRWLESENVRDYQIYEKESSVIDISYYRKKVDDAKDLIDRTVRESTNGQLGVDYFISDQVPEKHLLTNFGERFMNLPA